MKILSGKPDLCLFEVPDTLRARQRFALPTVWNNEGGAGQGLRVTVSGPAVEEGRVRGLQAVLGPAGQERRVALQPGRVGHQPVAFAEVPDWEIRPGVDAPSGAVSEAELAALGAAMIAVVIEGQVAVAGPTTLFVVVSARETAGGDLAMVDLDLS